MKHWILGEKAPFSKNMPLSLLFFWFVCLLVCILLWFSFFCVTVYLKPRPNDQTFSSNIVFVTRNVPWLNGQTMFDQTSDNGKPFKSKIERGG